MLLANEIAKLEGANPAIFSLPSIPGVCVIMFERVIAASSDKR
jgi:hypothetical protein